MKDLVLWVVIGAVIGFAIIALMRNARSAGTFRPTVGESIVERVVDTENSVVCYVIPQAHCMGDCAYSPAISCVKVVK